MSRTIRDDISALCSHARMDEAAYKLFPSSRNGSQATPSAIRAFPPQGNHPELTSAGERQQVRRSRASLILDNVSATPAHEKEKHPPACATLCFLSNSGGTGKTTLLATLARIYSAVGRSVLLVDECPQTLLPFYFGGRPGIGQGGRFAALREARSGPVRILSREGEDADWLTKGLVNFGQAADYVLVDCSPALSRHALLTAANALPVVVLACDMSSALTVRRTLDSFAGSASHLRSPLFVLNRFDPGVSLHVEIRDWMAKELGESLLPITIRRSEEPAEAMAEGLTVFDYAPDSPLTQDYLALAGILQESSQPAEELPFAARAGYR